MATKVIENTNTRLFGLICFGKMASIYSANGPKTIAPVASHLCDFFSCKHLFFCAKIPRLE